MTAAVVDFHAHWFPPEYLRVVEELAGTGSRDVEATLAHPHIRSNPRYSGPLEHRVELLNRAGINEQVLSFSSPHVWDVDATDRRRLCRAFNDGCAQVTAANERFTFLAMLPLPDVESALDELARAISLPGCRGVSLPASPAGWPIDHETWTALYERLDALRTVVLVHPDGFSPDLLDDYYLEWTVGAPFADTVAAVRLACAGHLQRWPGISWVIPHAGGCLPFLRQRIDRLWAAAPSRVGTAVAPSELFQTLVFDTANSGPAEIALAMKTTERLVLGTDYPYAFGDDLSPAVTVVREVDAGSACDGILNASTLPTRPGASR